MMRIDIVTLFPKMCEDIMSESIIGNARRDNLIEVYTHNIRDYANDKHNRVDGYPYGGGPGMLLRPEPIYRCITQIKAKLKDLNPHVIYMSPKGAKLNQQKVLKLKELKSIIILAGHYEGVDQRVLDVIVDEEISIGDYVLTGGELPALVLADAILRCVPGVLASDECFLNESHVNGMLEHAQYTKPENWHGFRVPKVLLSGNHQQIESWQKTSAQKITAQNRPDLLNNKE